MVEDVAENRVRPAPGRARQGSTRAPHYRTGGVVFGPHPRSYEKAMPRKMRRLAMRSVLSARAAEHTLTGVAQFALGAARPRALPAALVVRDVLDDEAFNDVHRDMHVPPLPPDAVAVDGEARAVRLDDGERTQERAGPAPRAGRQRGRELRGPRPPRPGCS